MPVPRTFPKTRSLLCTLASVVLAGVLSTAAPKAGELTAEMRETLGLGEQQVLDFTVLKERPLPPDHPDPSRFVRRIEMANAGEDRFVWRLTFGAAYPQESLLQLYIDADNSIQTGRKDMGCEFMLKMNGRTPLVTAFRENGVVYLAKHSPSVAVSGDSVYFSYDLALAQENGQSKYRMMVLSETLNPHKSADAVRFFAASGPAISTKPKIKFTVDVDASVGVGHSFGPKTIDPLLRREGNVRLPIRSCKLTGFTLRRSEYRTENATCLNGRGRIQATVPVDGRFFPGFVIHDQPGREVVKLSLRGKQQGIALADYDDNDQHLFFLDSALELRKGDSFSLQAMLPSGAYRIEDLVLLREKPKSRQPVYELTHLERSGERGNRITWISSWPATCTVEFDDDTRISEDSPRNNHRIYIPEDKRKTAKRWRLKATAPTGETICSEWKSLALVRPRVQTIQAGRIPLRLYAPGGKIPAPWPATGGVPFPKGILGDAANLRLVNADGERVPSQIHVTSRWMDGSVRWILVDFRHTGESSAYTLEYGPETFSPEPEFKPPAPPEELGELELVDGEGKIHTAKVSGFKLLTVGSERTEWLAQGQVGEAGGNALFAWQARLHDYRGLRRIQLSYGSDYAGKRFTSVKSLRWKLPEVTGKDAFARQLIDDRYESSTGAGKRFAGALGTIRVRDFWQNYPSELRVSPTGSIVGLLPALPENLYDWARGKPEEHRLFYWFDNGKYKLRQGMTKTREIWLGNKGSAPLLDRPIYLAPPPSWFLKSGTFGEYSLDGAKGTITEAYDQSVFHCMDLFEQRREKNREYGQFNFGDWWGERVINWGNTEYDTAHGFFLQFVRSGDFRFFQRAEEAELHHRDIDTVHRHSDAKRRGRVYAHCIGHVGDYYAKSPLPGKHQGSPRGGFTVTHTWCEGHSEHYFLTGDRRSIGTARLIADAADAAYINNYDFTNCRFPGWQLILSMAVYRATNDPFYLNTCRIIVERVLERQTLTSEHGVGGGGWRRMMVPGHCFCDPFHYGNAGFMVGILLTGLRHFHQETNDPQVALAIRRATRFLVDDMWVPRVNGFRYTSCPSSSAGPWSNMLLFDGISYAYRLEPDSLLARVMFLGGVPGVSRDTGFGKSFSQKIRVAPHCLATLQKIRDNPPLVLANFTVQPPLPFSRSQDAQFSSTSSAYPTGKTEFIWDFGDGSGGRGKNPKHRYAEGGVYEVKLTIHSETSKDSQTLSVVIPPKTLLATEQKGAFAIEAETFSAQGGGKVRIANNRQGASGTMVTAWHANLGHWLEWSVDAPESGSYNLILKYATDGSQTRRELLLNGLSPDPAGKSILFPRTGGYCTQTDNWRYLLVGGQQPVKLQLKAGKNTIRLTNLGDGLALDQLFLLPASR